MLRQEAAHGGAVDLDADFLAQPEREVGIAQAGLVQCDEFVSVRLQHRLAPGAPAPAARALGAHAGCLGGGVEVGS